MPSSYHKLSLVLSFRAQLECHLLGALSGCHLLLGPFQLADLTTTQEIHLVSLFH